MNSGVQEKKCPISIGYVLCEPKVGQAMKIISPSFIRYSSKKRDKIAVDWNGNVTDAITEIIELDDFIFEVTTASQKVFLVELIH